VSHRSGPRLIRRSSVDIYHTDPAHPRFAYVQYTNMESGEEAIRALHHIPINFNSPYAQENAADLADWEGWQGQMKVMRNDGTRFIPTPAEEMFPGVAGWMVGKSDQKDGAGKFEGEMEGGAGGADDPMRTEEEMGRKRTRSIERRTESGVDA
jgi:hypothetical protein